MATTAAAAVGRPAREDAWGDIAKVYAKLTAATTLPPTKRIVARANEARPFNTADTILDLGCGPGPVISQLLQDYSSDLGVSTKLIAADFSPAMAKQLETTKAEAIAAGQQAWKKLEVLVQDAQSLDDINSGTISHVVSGFMFMLVPNPKKALAATHRVMQVDGVLSLSCWQSTDWINIMASANEIPRDRKPDGLPEEWSSIDGVKNELKQAGFRDPQAELVEVKMGVPDYESAINFYKLAPPMVSAMADYTDEEKARVDEIMLRKLKEQCPTVPGELTGTAIVACARK